MNGAWEVLFGFKIITIDLIRRVPVPDLKL